MRGNAVFLAMAIFITATQSALGLPAFTYRCRLDPTASLTSATTTHWTLGKTTILSDGTDWSPSASFNQSVVANGPLIKSAEIAMMKVIVIGNTSASKGSAPTSSLRPVTIEVTLSSSDHSMLTLRAQLFGPRLALVLSKDLAVVPVAVQTMADFNTNTYTKAAAGIKVMTPPRRFPVMDRFISGDDNIFTWAGGIQLLTQLGMHGLEVQSGNGPNGYPVYSSVVRQALLAAGQNITSSAEYAAPGTAPATGRDTAASLSKWAQEIAGPFTDAGYQPHQMTVFALADEPAWSFPGSAPEASYAALRPQWEAFLQGAG
jgi:hypothetical protein